MNEQIFRKKSLERVSSPEQLNEYIRVSNPGVWMVLAAVVLLLVGVCVWGVVGTLDTKLPAAAVCTGGELTVYVKEDGIASVKEGMTVRIGETEGEIIAISAEPVAAEDALSEYARHVGQLQDGQWVYAVLVSASVPDGVHTAQIVVESIAPMSFLLN